MKKMMLLMGTGGAIGYVLGSRAGRERYESIKSQASTLADKTNLSSRLPMKSTSWTDEPFGNSSSTGWADSPIGESAVTDLSASSGIRSSTGKSSGAEL